MEKLLFSVNWEEEEEEEEVETVAETVMVLVNVAIIRKQAVRHCCLYGISSTAHIFFLYSGPRGVFLTTKRKSEDRKENKSSQLSLFSGNTFYVKLWTKTKLIKSLDQNSQ